MTARFDIAVIGAGSGGLTVAAAAARFGQRVVLFEKGEMGGECLNSGCVPSKALLAAAKQAHAMRSGAALGIAPAEPVVDFAAVRAHVGRTIAAIAPHDGQERFEAMGVRVVRAAARFAGCRTIAAAGEAFTARRIVIATGSRPAVPPVPGLEAVPFLTNETIFGLATLPRHLLILGAGAMGLEMAQAFRRLGSDVTVVEAGRPLAQEDPELAAVLLARLAAEGVVLRSGRRVTGAAAGGGQIRLSLEGGEEVAGSHLLIAAGRRPNVEGLDLAAAGVAAGKTGIAVDRSCRTSNRAVYAVGDVAGGRFTHEASHQAGLVIRHALFALPGRPGVIPQVTYTEPEIARVGLTEAEARAAHGEKVKVLRTPFAANDRALAEAAAEGLVKVVAGPRGRVLGAAIAGPGAGELIQPWVLAMTRGLSLGQVAGVVSPYPTRGEASRRAALEYFSAFPSNPLVRGVIGAIGRLRP